MSLAQFAGRDESEVAGYASLIAHALLSRGFPGLQTVCGAGLTKAHTVNGESLVPLVLVAQERVNAAPDLRLPLAPGEIRPLAEIRSAFEVVETALGFTPRPSILAFCVTPPAPQVASSEYVTQPNIGTVGCGATWQIGATHNQGFLTAGHVAPAVGADVFTGPAIAGGSKVGTVRYASNPAGHGSALMADVAVVELDAGQTFTNRSGPIGTAPPNGAVSILSPGGAMSSILAYASFVYWPNTNGTYGDTYLTASHVTSGGDSGSAVVHGKDVIGLVIGGSPGATTYIQDIHYLLASAGGPGSGLGPVQV